MISQLSSVECGANVVAQWSVDITLISYENLSLFSVFVKHSGVAYFRCNGFSGVRISKLTQRLWITYVLGKPRQVLSALCFHRDVT